jgi:hypothetical protein
MYRCSRYTFRVLSRRAYLCTMTIVLACMGALSSDRAWADTAPYSNTHVYFNLPDNGQPDQTTVIGWTNFIASIRNAAGHPITGVNGQQTGGYTTQSSGGDNDTAGGLIVATLTLDGATIRLFISPRDLYLRGFANNVGQLFLFADTNTNPANTYDLINAIEQNLATGYAPQMGNSSYTLPFSSNYNSMASANNGNGREALTMNYGNFTDAFWTLASLTQNQSFSDRAHVARCVMFMIQMTSEAARFNDVLGTARLVMGGNQTQQGLPVFQQYEENSWASLSNYGWNQLNQNYYAQTFNGINPDTGNYTVYGTGDPLTIYNYGQLLNILAILLPGNQVANPDLGGVNQDWGHSEL